jgi:hypothetical protein
MRPHQHAHAACHPTRTFLFNATTHVQTMSPVSSYIYYKSPNIVYRANNVLVDAQLSTQYFKQTMCFFGYNPDGIPVDLGRASWL